MSKERTRTSGETARQNVSLADVARVAGVSTASVSRVLNKPDMVRASLRSRIEAAIQELGYIPSGAARALKTSHTRTIGAIVPTLDNPIFAHALSALQKRLASLGYTLVVAASEFDWEQEVSEARALLTHGAEGLVLIGDAHSPKLYETLRRAGVAYVNCWTYGVDGTNPCIGFDNRSAAKRLVEYLIQLGHRDVAMIAGITAGNDRAKGRVEGVRDALKAVHRNLENTRYVEQPYGILEGRNGLRALLDQSAKQPTAIVCGNDILALGALFECQARGIEVPRMLSIAGFDDLPISAHVQPGLTTVRVPASEMGRFAADFLVQRLSGRNPIQNVMTDTSLVVRGTTAPPRSGLSNVYEN